MTACCVPLMSSQIEVASTNQDHLRNDSSVHLLRDPGKVLGHATAKSLTRQKPCRLSQVRVFRDFMIMHLPWTTVGTPNV